MEGFRKFVSTYKAEDVIQSISCRPNVCKFAQVAEPTSSMLKIATLHSVRFSGVHLIRPYHWRRPDHWRVCRRAYHPRLLETIIVHIAARVAGKFATHDAPRRLGASARGACLSLRLQSFFFFVALALGKTARPQVHTKLCVVTRHHFVQLGSVFCPGRHRDAGRLAINTLPSQDPTGAKVGFARVAVEAFAAHVGRLLQRI